ncbi:unnamed protein product [Angiostrongylus costaricensis]|uniref:U6 small nuclear RNA (adenine-(43)-N(6))-methyltransferase n=1 Tax=Angiostrongylus costaricensis TaxID=334426 RepID=A0A0R3PT72_ANGCS|nr:unnamed protein product [Angiostrongylus costaricensis]
MSLNRSMHPRNPYKESPPDFNDLATRFPDFRAHCTLGNNGRVFVNFQEDGAVRSLTKALLKKDFDLEVELPHGCLVPRVPQRLNYILFIEDLLKLNQIENNVIGIDIGTGASCIYALLGARWAGWKFFATETNTKAAEAANANVVRNRLGHLIRVIHISEQSTTLIKFTFCMCNPPFFESCETSKVRFIGGEVAFIGRLIDESVLLQTQVSIYTTMLGKKSSISVLCRRLSRIDGVRYTVSTLSQGRTLRWVLAWTFLPQIHLENVRIPFVIFFRKVSLLFFFLSQTLICSARNVTWTNQRAKRRADAKLNTPAMKRMKFSNSDVGIQVSMGVGDGRDSLSNSGNFESCISIPNSYGRFDVHTQAYFPCPVRPSVLRFRVIHFRENCGISFEYIDGYKPGLYQLLQFLKNQIK